MIFTIYFCITCGLVELLDASIQLQGLVFELEYLALHLAALAGVGLVILVAQLIQTRVDDVE